MWYNFISVPKCQESHHQELLKILAIELGVDVADIIDLDLNLYDNQPAQTGGINDEFILSERLDNLMMTYTTLEVIIHILNILGIIAEFGFS